jgi:hypothetical protein
MAGKTFPGIGDLEDESPPVDPADAADSGAGQSRPSYSGPTVVDDLKVEEGLKKLRSLDMPLVPLTGITKAVVDALESGPSRLTPQVPVDLSKLTAQVVGNPLRETAVGRNVVGPTVGQQEIPPPFDDRALRGTLFGHSIHAPEFALSAPEEPPAPGALALVNRGAPTTTVAVYQPQHSHGGGPPEAEPVQRSSRYRDTPLTPVAVSDVPARKKLAARVAIGAAGIAAIVGVALIWTRSTGDDSGGSPSAASRPPVAALPMAPTPPAAPPVAARPVAPTPAAARESEPEPMAVVPPVPAAPPVVRPVVRPVARRVAGPPNPTTGESAPTDRPHHAHTAAPHVDKRHTTADGDRSSDGDTPTPKVRKRAAEEDPDATMAPSIE